jgi:uncharacterized protein YcbK (DUF882 family)
MDPSAFGMEQDFWSMPRTLWLTRPATGEEVRAVYFADGQIIPEGYRQICILLRDVRANQAVQMSPVLLDILCGLQGMLLSYGVYSPLVTNSGYRSDTTNALTEGAARNSKHREGRAWDGRILNVRAEITTRAALYLAGGGVGFYQDKNFTHVDDGRIRFWRG